MENVFTAFETNWSKNLTYTLIRILSPLFFVAQMPRIAVKIHGFSTQHISYVIC